MIGASAEEAAVLLVGATDRALRHLASRNRNIALKDFRPLVVDVVFAAVMNMLTVGVDDAEERRIHDMVDALTTVRPAPTAGDGERLTIDFDAIARRLHGERDTDPSPSTERA